MHAATDMAYMEKAVFDMLSSRLEKAGQVRIIEGDIRASDVSDMTILGEKHHTQIMSLREHDFFRG